MRTGVFGCFVAACVALSAHAVFGVVGTATFTPLGKLAGTYNYEVGGISDNGSIIVGTANNSSTNTAVRWVNTTVQPLLSPSDRAIVFDVSGDGTTVVGEVYTGTNEQAFRWTASGGLQDMGGTGTADSAHAVSFDGSVVTGVSTNGGFRWTAATGMTSLPKLPGGVGGVGEAISADGTIIVGGADDTTGFQATRWIGNSITALGDFSGGVFFSRANAVSPDGSIIVGTGRDGSGDQAFRWTSASGMQGLGHIPSAPYISGLAYNMTADGSIVVGEDGGRAFIWDAPHGMRTLSSYLQDDFGLSLPGWTLNSANVITPDGRVIAGRAFSSATGAVGYQVVVPEPTSIALVPCLALMLASRRRRVL